jgi:hypothetical protein
MRISREKRKEDAAEGPARYGCKSLIDVFGWSAGGSERCAKIKSGGNQVIPVFPGSG